MEEVEKIVRGREGKGKEVKEIRDGPGRGWGTEGAGNTGSWEAYKVKRTKRNRREWGKEEKKRMGK